MKSTHGRRNVGALYEFRKLFGLTIEAMAARLGVSPAFYSKFEKGGGVPSALVAFHAASLFGLRLVDLLNLDYTSKPLFEQGQYPLYRLAHNIPSLKAVESFTDLNKPSNIENQHFALRESDIRALLMYEVYTALADKEQTLAQETLTPTSIMEYVVPGPQPGKSHIDTMLDENGKLIEGIKLGETFAVLSQLKGMGVGQLSQITGLSRAFFGDLENDRSESVLTGSLDLTARAFDLTIDEYMYVSLPQLLGTKWPFFVHHYPQSYQNTETLTMLTSPDTIQAFKTRPIKERAKMMLSYHTWLRDEADARVNKTKVVYMPPALQPFKFAS